MKVPKDVKALNWLMNQDDGKMLAVVIGLSALACVLALG